jgi:hypothetical protein
MATDYDEVNNAVTTEYGIDVLYTAEGQSPVTLRGIFDYTYFEAEGGVGIQARQARLTIEDKDAPAIKNNELITAKAKNFIIRQVRPDGEGITELDLEEQI